MALNDVLPSYVKPYTIERSNSECLSALDFGEFYYSLPSDGPDYPHLKLVYNGKALNIQSELIHASLAGISIKHYYGKCYQQRTEADWEEVEKDSFYDYGEGEVYTKGWFDEERATIGTANGRESRVSEDGATENGSFEYREDSVAEEGRPICTMPRINFRNSFWNIHRPELCKLTWGQTYVSTATVTDHLHDHLKPHGQLCDGFHTETDRTSMLNKELDDYVRLKVVAQPRELPPDEPLFHLSGENPQSKGINPKCKGIRKVAGPVANRYIPLRDDEEIGGRSIHRSKEEFCLTIGKYVSQPLSMPPSAVLQKVLVTPELSSSAAEEAGGHFLYSWFLYGEEPLENPSSHSMGTSYSESNSESLEEPCPPLALDDFCRVVGKADFSDLRCNPDF